MKSAGQSLMVLGVVLLVIGLLVYSGALSWFGRLPGDLRWEGEHTRVYFPLASMLLLSVALSVLLGLLSVVLRRLLP
ncbi:DUF2905 domain-containing protein [Vitiosangium sp. GDMCC 1.1324]|uniref:DUF2905 domain-containing protein n=1 Tax=Vitiosangium sp. (strain GDMCC 1.1324) TaxID=2138576 RepID=UPI001E486F2A|nr:DUF2905 domain-containing protein [Vitiosangium sp. GDMCC 1.1324]